MMERAWLCRTSLVELLEACLVQMAQPTGSPRDQMVAPARCDYAGPDHLGRRSVSHCIIYHDLLLENICLFAS